MRINTPSLLPRLARSLKSFVRMIGKIMAPATRAIPASCININTLLLHLCDWDQCTYRYVLKWLAYPLQNPGAKMQYALVVNGELGTGAAMFFENVIGPIYGDTARNIQAASLEGTLSSWATGARFITVNGAFTDRAAAILKGLIISDTLRVRAPYATQSHNEKNCMNFVFLSGSRGFLPVGAGNRRFMVIETPPARERLFYMAVAAEIQAGGAEAFRDYLMSAVDLGDFNQFCEPPASLARREVA